MEEKLKELLSNEEYVKELVELRTPSKIRESLLNHDVDISEKDIEKSISLLKKKASGELSDEELNEVAGGSVFFVLLSIIGPAAVGGIAAGIRSC